MVIIMAKRKIYKDRYQKAINHIIATTEIESMYLAEAKTCLRHAKQSKDRVALNSYFNHIDFILEDVFGVKVALP